MTSAADEIPPRIRDFAKGAISTFHERATDATSHA